MWCSSVLVFTFTAILHLTSLKSCVNKLDLQSSVILLLPFTRFLTQFIFQRHFCDCLVLVASISTNYFLLVQYETFSPHLNTIINEIDPGLDHETVHRDFTVEIVRTQISVRQQEMDSTMDKPCFWAQLRTFKVSLCHS